MSTLSQFFSGSSPIKSIQRGTITIPANATSATATITSVNTSKTMINFLGYNHDTAYTSYSPNIVVPRITLTNSTTVTATKGTSHFASVTIVSYEVIEFN
jgi:hypothetical protein